MATTIYKVEEIKCKRVSYVKGINISLEIRNAERAYIKQLRDYLKLHLPNLVENEKHFGKVFGIPFADSYAYYMVISLGRINKLLFLDMGDAWSYPYIERLTKKDIESQLVRGCMFAEKEGV